VEALNSLPGSTIDESAGGGVVLAPRGVVHAGDLIDSGDKSGTLHEEMQRTEWNAYLEAFGLSGSDGRLRYPVYEVHGNHDGPQGRGVVVDGIRERNRTRPGIDSVSENGLHYAWDWGPVRFLNLGIVVGSSGSSDQKRRYDPLGSLPFLVADLEKHVGDSGRPVVITHHVDVARYSIPCEEGAPANLQREWNPCDVRAFYDAVAPYRIAAILYGHTHARSVRRWDGASADAESGLPLFNVDNSSHFAGTHQAFFYFEIDGKSVNVRERATTDGWVTSGWTPQAWQSDWRT
jgi:predicted phosphodiesterase